MERVDLAVLAQLLEPDDQLDRDLVQAITDLHRLRPEIYQRMLHESKEPEMVALCNEVIAAQDPEHRFHDAYAALL